MKNLISAYKYQLGKQMNAAAWFYGTVIVLYTVTTIITKNIAGVGVSTNAAEFSAIFLFVMGLCSFKENFFMLTQNNVSRGTIFKSRLMVAVTAALVVALADILITGAYYAMNADLISRGWFRYTYMIDGGFFVPAEFLFKFALNLTALAAGYFITTMFYRLNRTGKVIVGAGVPTLVFIIFPLVDFFLIGDPGGASVIQAIADAVKAMELTTTALYTIPILLLLSIIFSGLAWLLIRRAPVKK